MGQYHLTVNLDKKEFIDPHRLGDGLKLWEQMNSQGGTMAALYLLLACACKGGPRGGGDPDYHPLIGSWAGNRIAVVGDYAEDTDLPNSKDKASEIYGLCRDGVYKDITDDIIPALERECEVKITEEEGSFGTFRKRVSHEWRIKM